MAKAWSRIDWQDAFRARWLATEQLERPVAAMIHRAGWHWSRENGLEWWPERWPPEGERALRARGDERR